MTQPQRYYLSSGMPSYTYDASTKCAKVYSRVTGATVCEVTGVDLYVGNLLSRLADEMYQDGYQVGRAHAIEALADHLDKMKRS